MMNPALLFGMALVVILLLVYLTSKKSPPEDTPTGGVAISDSPAVNKPIPEGGAPATMLSVNPVLPPSALIKRIIITKDTRDKPDPEGSDGTWRTFQVAEVYVWVDDKKLTASDFSDAVLSSEYAPQYGARNAIDGDVKTFTHNNVETLGILTLTLKDPKPVTSIHIINRLDCCKSRMDGVYVNLEDASGDSQWSGKMSGSQEIYVFSAPHK